MTKPKAPKPQCCVRSEKGRMCGREAVGEATIWNDRSSGQPLMWFWVPICERHRSEVVLKVSRMWRSYR